VPYALVLPEVKSLPVAAKKPEQTQNRELLEVRQNLTNNQVAFWVQTHEPPEKVY
jgi:hypothetical protein